MKKLSKILAVISCGLIVGTAALLAYITKFKPNIPVEEVQIEYTPERVERGRHLANNRLLKINKNSQSNVSKQIA